MRRLENAFNVRPLYAADKTLAAAPLAGTMNNLELEELLSAYLDGELTPEDQARIEHALAESRELRQWYEEHLALRATLRSLPEESLDDGFSHRVLERILCLAEAKPAPGAPGAMPQPAESPPVPEVVIAVDSRARRRMAKLRRALKSLRGGAMAAAAALLIVAVLVHSFRGGSESDPELASTHPNAITEDFPEGKVTDPLTPNPAQATEEDSEPRHGLARKDSSPKPQGDAQQPRSSELPPQPALVRSPDAALPPQEGPKIAVPPQLSPESVEERPLVASSVPEPNQEPFVGTAAPIASADRVVLEIDYDSNLNKRNLHVIRLHVSPQVMREKMLDDILERKAVTFAVAKWVRGGRRLNGDRVRGALPEIDFVLAHGFPPDMEAVLDEVRRRPEHFRPWAVYPVSQGKLLDWLPLLLEIPSPERGEVDLAGPDALAQINAILEDPRINRYAWRSPAEKKLLDSVFPIPAKASPNPDRKPYAAADPNLEMDVIFLLYLRERE